MTPSELKDSCWEQEDKNMNSYTIQLESHFSGAREITLTTERAESCYGEPVAVLIGGPNNGTAYGPSDVIPSAIENNPLEWLTEPAAVTVAAANIAANGDSANPLLCAFLAPFWR